MKRIQSKILYAVFLCCMISFHAYADWVIVGDAVPHEAQAVLTQNKLNSQEFVYVGKLTNEYFKITDGVKTYIHLCGDNDPLEQSISLREQDNANETGMRIRYVGPHDYFRVTLTATRNSQKVIVERIVPPKYLYIMGGPFNTNAQNWLLEDAVPLERDARNPFLFYYRGDIRYNPVGSEGGNIKLLVGRTWGSNYHPDTSGNIPLAQASKMRLNGEDNKWSIPADRSRDGHYVIKVNTLDMTISIEDFVHDIDATPRSIFITGDAMSCGWSNTAPVMMHKQQAGVYLWQGQVLTGQFKFLQRKGTWEKCYVARSANEQVQLGSEHAIAYEENYMSGEGNDYKFVIPEAGDYRFEVDLNAMTMRVGASTSDLKTIYQEQDGMKIFVHNGKLHLQSENEQYFQVDIFSIEGKKITEKTFFGNAEIHLYRGFYLVLVSNEAGERITNSRILIY